MSVRSILLYWYLQIGKPCKGSAWLHQLINHDHILFWRWMAIRTPLKHHKITIRSQILAIIACWFCGCIWASAPLFGWNRYAFEGAYTSCSIVWNDNSVDVFAYNITIFVFVLIVPVVLIVLFNISLYLTVPSIYLLYMMIDIENWFQYLAQKKYS